MKYLVIQSRSVGFWSDTAHAAGCFLLAEITGRIPIAHWDGNSRYNDNHSTDSFRKFFEPVSEMSIGDIPLTTERFREQQRPIAELCARQESIIVLSNYHFGIPDVAPYIPSDHPMRGESIESLFHYIFAKYMAPVPSIQKAIDDFQQQHLGEHFLAIHLRGTDKFIEQADIKAINDACIRRLKGLDDKFLKIFLLTDDTRLLETMTSDFGDRLVVTASQRSGGDDGLHNLKSGLSLGREIVIDTYLAARAYKFFGNGLSNVASAVALMRPWTPGCCLLTCDIVMLRTTKQFPTSHADGAHDAARHL